MSRVLRCALLAALLAPAACGNKGTFVIVDLPSGPADKVASIHANVTLAGKSAETDFTPKGGGTFAFPTSASLEIGNGEGTLAVTATALDAGGATIATAMGSVDVVRDSTVHLSLPFEDVQPTDGSTHTGDLVIGPTSFDFGTVLTGSMSAPKRFMVMNTGTQTSGTLMALLNGMDAADYVLQDSADAKCIGQALPAGAGCAVEVRFSPKSAGLVKNAVVRVLAPDGTPGGTATAVLLGSAGEKGDLMLSASATAFMPTLVGASSAEITYTLTNGGNTATTQVTTNLSGTDASAFKKTMDGCTGTTLAPKQTCTMKALFMPTSRGMKTATLSATATKGGTAVADLTGTAQVPAVLTITGAATMAVPANLGTVDVGMTGTMKHTFTVKNDGDFDAGPLGIDTMPTSNAQVSPTAATTCMPGMTLAAGQSCTGELVLMPSSFGVKNAQVVFSATPGGTVSTYVTGVGRDQVTLTVGRSGTNSDGADGVVSDTATPTPLNCGPGGSQTTCSRTYTRTTIAPMVALLATPDGNSTFTQWNGVTCSSGNTTSPCSFTLGPGFSSGSTVNVNAQFKKLTYTLTYTRTDFQYKNAASALGVATFPGTTCNGPCTGTVEVNRGSSVTINAAADGAGIPGGFSLRRIAGACGTSSKTGAAATCTFTMDGPKTVNVVYSAHNFAFVTSGIYTANLKGGSADGLTGADVKCQTEAAAQNLPGTFVALLSSSQVDAKTRLGSAQGWIRTDGKPFAASATELFTNGAILYPLVLDAAQVSHAGDDVFTSSHNDGTKNPTAGTSPAFCGDWTNTTSNAQVFTGRVGSVVPEWMEFLGGVLCPTKQARLFCMSSDLNNPIAPLPTAGLRMAFLTSNAFATGVNGYMNADNLCQNGAANNTVTSQRVTNGAVFKAYIAGAGGALTSSAASRFNAAGAPWARIDGVLLANTAAEWLGTTTFKPTAALNLMDNQAFDQGYDRVWSGATDPNTAPPAQDACTGWTSASGNGQSGYTFRSDGTMFATTPTVACSSAMRVYCLEQ